MSGCRQDGCFCWRECATRDVDRARRFYTRVFGWTAREIALPRSIGGTYTILEQDGQAVAGLFAMRGAGFEGAAPHWATYVWVEDLAGALERVEALGGHLLAAPLDFPPYGTMAVVGDPQGATLALLSGASALAAADEDGPGSRFVASELWARDPAAARPFYEGLVGWRADAPHDPLRPLAAPGEAPGWTSTVAVDDLEATLGRVVAEGGRVEGPAKGPPTAVWIRDPEGARLGVTPRP